MKISIITPSYNQAKFLEETILSVINQGYHDLEFIVIDGGSKDHSVDIIKAYEKYITYWVSEKDKGQSDAINKGLKKATGEIIGWINSDDLLLPGSLQKIGEIFQSLPENIGVIHGGAIIFEGEKDLREIYNYGIPSVEKYLSGMAFSQPAAFFRKIYLDRVGLLREDLHYGMDYDLFARLACVCKFQPVDHLFSKYRLHNDSKSVAHSNKFRHDWDRVFFSIIDRLGWEDVMQLSLFRTNTILNNDNTFAPYQDFFVPDQIIVGTVNQEKVLFYYLCDLLLHYYWYDERNNARILYSKMKDRFPRQWFYEEKRVTSAIRKLQLPEIALVLLKKVKGILRK